MGSKGGSWLVALIVLCAFSFPQVHSAGNQTRDSLNSLLYASVLQGVPKLRTGTFYTVAPPANLSGMGIISMVRLRANRLWMDGANFSSVEVPPRTAVPRPFTRRIDMVYQNLGNWSASYYGVPNHTFVAPVVAFLVYDSHIISSTNHTLIDLNLLNTNTSSNDNSIRVHFPGVQEDARLKCVRFDASGAMDMSDVTAGNTCLATGSGHFSIVIPDEAREVERKTKKKKSNKFKWWIVGVIAGGIVGLGIIAILGYKLSEWEKVRRMERQTERSERLGTIWIGVSRMPTASGIRTQPILENTYVP